MCNIKDGFKLCTCATTATPPSSIGWELRRTNPHLPLQHRKGKTAMIRYNTSEQALQTLILDNLNQSNCFDFDYTPQDNDYLRIKGQTTQSDTAKWFRYRYNGKKQAWQIDTTSSLAAWKTQLEALEQGKVE
jgi:hypothetical protein